MANTDQVPLLEEPISNGPVSASPSGNYLTLVFLGCMNTLVYSLIAVSVFVTLWFAFQSIPLSAFQLHIGLSVAGYQILMAYGILSLSSYNGWWSSLTYAQRRTSHWVLQLVGSALAIGGSVIMIRHKSVNFNTIHGKLALAALVLTSISLINGVMTLYRVSFRSFLPSKLFKINHLIFGTSAFAISSVCLSFGYIKESFRNWSSDTLAYFMIGITCMYTFLIILKPCNTIIRNIYNLIFSRNS